MEELDLRKIFSERLTSLRKEKGLTQSQLGEVLKYSDKSISKWERAEALPDVVTLCTLSDFFCVPVNYFLSEEKPKLEVKESKTKKHILISLISSGLVWLVASICFCMLSILTTLDHLWLTFIISTPAMFIVLTILSCLWFNYFVQCLFSSCIVWSGILTMFLFISLIHVPNAWLLFTIGAVLQILLVLLFILKNERRKNKLKKSLE